MTPITRLEVFLNGIINGGEVPEPITRTEIMLNDIKNGDVVTLTPITRGECYLARISGADVQIPEPVTRVEMYLAKKCGVDINTPSPIVRLEHWLNAWASGEDPLVTLTGKIISFFSRAAKPFKSTQLAIEPVQDLHGYEAPWPPGGGVNKFPTTYSAKSASVDYSDGKITMNPLSEQSHVITFPFVGDATTTYTWSFYAYSDESGAVFTCDGQPDSGASGLAVDHRIAATTTPTRYSFTGILPSTNTGLRFFRANTAALSSTATIYIYDIQIEVGSTPTAWSPYSNISPISGWTGATVVRDGKNLIDMSGVDHSSGIVYESVKLLAGTYYIYQFTKSPSHNTYFQYSLNGTNWTAIPTEDDGIAVADFSSGSYGRSKNKFTLHKNCYFRIGIQGNANVESNPIDVLLTIDSENYAEIDGGADTSAYAYMFEPFSGTSVSLTFGQTVYGGSATDNGDGSWTLKVFPYYASYNGEPLVGPWLSSMDKYAAGTTPTTGAQVVDLGGTQTTFTVSGDTLSTLVGTNNAWADTGNITAEVYGTPMT